MELGEHLYSIAVELSQKHNISRPKIKEIILSQFRFVAETIKKGELKAVRLRYFGLFGMNKYKKHQVYKYREMGQDKIYKERKSKFYEERKRRLAEDVAKYREKTALSRPAKNLQGL